jgi:exosortase H (IPTLxxWG-CTERM-specific)
MGAWRSRIRAWRADPRAQLVGFLLRLGLYLWVFTTLVTKLDEGIRQPVRVATAWVNYAILDLFTDKVSWRDEVITLDGFAVHIIDECVGWLEIVIFIAAVLAFKTSWRNRALGVVLGIVGIYFFNIVRIMVLVLVGRYAHEIFDFTHVYFWQATLIVLITGLWILWIRFVVRDETGPVVPT